MRRIVLFVLLATAPCLAQSSQSVPQETTGADPWFSTFSIIAFDPATKEFGVGVQSRAFGAGAAVPYIETGVGAVATQASANRQYGPKAIALLKQGLIAGGSRQAHHRRGSGPRHRQVAVIDAQGRSAVYTGKRVIDRNFDKNDPVHLGGFAGHATGQNFSAQGNTLASEEVVKAMAAAYEHGKGSMAERLMDALDAGQAKGGDTRGMQSAGILVVRPLPPELGVDGRADRRYSCRRRGESVQGTAAAALHDHRRVPTGSPNGPPRSARKANGRRRLPNRRRRSRSIRDPSNCSMPWRSSTRSRATRAMPWRCSIRRSSVSRKSGSRARQATRRSPNSGSQPSSNVS